MPTKPTQLRALLIGVPAPGLDIPEAISRLSNVLRTMIPGATIETIVDANKCTRVELLHRIHDWVEGAADGQPHLFYFFGHGGRVQFTDMPEVKDRIFYHLTCVWNKQGPTEGILDFEIAGELTKLHKICGNVTSIIDCCHSGLVAPLAPESETVEDVPLNAVQVICNSPEWAKVAIKAGPVEPLAAESHPLIVRLAAASPAREAFALDLVGPPGAVGSLTLSLVTELESLGQEWFRMSWEMLAHAVRQRVIEDSFSERQWITLAGASDRLLFSTTTTRSPSQLVGCVGVDGQYWIRAGALTGVEHGDHWALAALFVDDNHNYCARAQGTAIDVESNRARLSFPFNVPAEQRKPVAAFLERVIRPMPVHVVDPDVEPSLGLDTSVWLTSGGVQSDQHVRLRDGLFELIDVTDRWKVVRYRDTDAGRKALRELLEDRARTRRLITSFVKESVGMPRPPIEWQVGTDTTPLQSGARVKAGEPLWVRLQNTEALPVYPTEQPETWFVAVVLIDVIGQPWLLNSSQLDSVELGPQDVEFIGQRLGGVLKGLKLEWPTEIIKTATPEGKLQIVFAMSRRPLQLGHLTHALRSTDPAVLRMQGLPAMPPNQPLSFVRAADDAISASDDLSKLLVLSEAWGFGSFELIMERS